jgi:hypothetical protein
MSTNNNSIECLLINVRSLVTKMQLFKLYIYNMGFPDLVGVSESWVDDSVPSSMLDLPGYVLLRGDRPVHDHRSKAGGVLLYVKNGLNPHPSAQFHAIYSELCHCVIPLGNGDTLLVIVAYRPESNTAAQNDALYSDISACNSFSHSHVLLIGDFNFKDIQWESYNWPAACDNFMDAILTASLFQHVTIPTRKGNVLDLVFSNERYSVEKVRTKPGFARGDHLSVCFTFSGSFVPNSLNCRVLPCFKRTDWSKFNSTLRSNLHAIECHDVVSSVWERIRNSLIFTIESAVPCKITDNSQYSKKPRWADAVCLAALRNQKTRWRKYQRSQSEADHCHFLAATAIVNEESDRSILRFESLLAAHIKDDVKSFWSYVNSSIKSRPRVGPFRRADGSYSVSDQENADILAEYFASVYTEEVLPIPCLAKRTQASLSSVDFTTDVVKKSILKLKRGSAPGPDCIHTDVLIESCDTIAPSLSNLFTELFRCGTTPSDWRVANVIPIHKKGSLHEAANFRPISLTCPICRVMESIVSSAILEFATRENLFCSSQFGFLPGKSCLTQLIDFVNWITVVINDGDCSDVVYLDLKKAFDRVPRRRLLVKLQAHGIAGELLAWIDSFLRDRIQRVVVNGFMSKDISVLSGVPQGSVLGPVLFLFYVNDLDDCVTGLVRKFADDTKLARRIRMSDPRLSALDCTDMQFDLNSLTAWCQTWQMEFNVEKCSCLHFGHSNPNFTYELNTTPIPSRSSEKDLGVIVSDNLKFSEHCSAAARKAQFVLWCLRRTIKNLSKPIFLQLYKTLVRPHLEYCSSVWCPHYVRDVRLIEKVQERATKMCSSVSHLSSYEDRLIALDLQTLATRRIRSDLILLYKIVHNLIDLPLANLFSYEQDVGTRGHSLKLRPNVRPRLDCARFSYAYRVVDFWNRLPAATVSAQSIATFKKYLHASGVLPRL